MQTATQPIVPLLERKRNDFDPYVDNGGLVFAISGPDFAVVAGDTRLSLSYSILSRDTSKIHELTPTVFLASAGCHTDVNALTKLLQAKVHMYRQQHMKEMSINAAAQMLSVTLYQRRMMPYYAFCLLAGLDSEGKGAVYSYDAVGTIERVPYVAEGSGRVAALTILDSLVGHKNRTDAAEPLTLEAAIRIVKEIGVSADQFDIYVGDSLEIYAITKAGIHHESIELLKD